MSDPLWHHGLDSPGQNTGVGSLSLLQGIFPTQELNQGLLHCRHILYQLVQKSWLFQSVSKCRLVSSGEFLPSHPIKDLWFLSSYSLLLPCWWQFLILQGWAGAWGIREWGGGSYLVGKSCLTLATPWTVASQPPPSMGFARQEQWSGCHFLLQGIFQTQGLNLGLLQGRQILYCLSHGETREGGQRCQRAFPLRTSHRLPLGHCCGPSSCLWSSDSPPPVPPDAPLISCLSSGLLPLPPTLVYPSTSSSPAPRPLRSSLQGGECLFVCTHWGFV